MCFMRYPVSGTNPIGLIQMKNHRLSQQYESQWAAIETSAGVYDSDALAALDSIITFDRQNGISVIMGLYRTPRFYADNVTANPTYTDYITKGPWGNYGEGAHPTDLQAVANFITMLINRYNLPGGAWFDQYGATLGKGIQYWEPWNEPPLNTTSTNTNTTGDGAKATSFYWGNKNQLVDLCAVQYETIKALDPSVLMSSPGWTGANKESYLTTAGSEYNTTYGGDVCDAWCSHPYNHTPVFNPYGAWYADLVYRATTGFVAEKAALEALGFGDLPLWITEWGVEGAGASDTLTSFYAEDAGFRKLWMQRTFLTMAANGVQMVHPWNWETTCCSGDWQEDTEGVQAAYNWFATNVVGKTITQVRYYTDGRVGVTVDGQEITV